MTSQPSKPILNADDYAMTMGVSAAIEDLAKAHRLSAMSVMTNMPDWPALAARARDLRGTLAIGLHLNLTLGAPTGPTPTIAPDGRFPELGPLIKASLVGQLSKAADIGDEIRRQLDLFETHLGHPPDHIDGHQHVQVLRGIRTPLLDELAHRYPTTPPLVRDPADSVSQIVSRGVTGLKAATIKLLAARFAADCRARRLPTNSRFAGFSTFDTATSYVTEIETELARAQADDLAIVMCHPGFPDAELAALDPIVARRRQEFDGLNAIADLPSRIWHADRAANGAPITWAPNHWAPNNWAHEIKSP